MMAAITWISRGGIRWWEEGAHNKNQAGRWPGVRSYYKVEVRVRGWRGRVTIERYLALWNARRISWALYSKNENALVDKVLSGARIRWNEDLAHPQSFDTATSEPTRISSDTMSEHLRGAVPRRVSAVGDGATGVKGKAKWRCGGGGGQIRLETGITCCGRIPRFILSIFGGPIRISTSTTWSTSPFILFFRVLSIRADAVYA